MLSNHSQTELAEPIAWCERAKRRFSTAKLVGSGRWLVIVYDGVHVFGFSDYDSALLFAVGHEKWRIVDLADEPEPFKPLPCGNIKSAVEADDRRQERREARQRREEAAK